MRARAVTYVQVPRRRRRKRLAKKLAKAGYMRLKALPCLGPFRTDAIGIHSGCTFYTDLA